MTGQWVSTRPDVRLFSWFCALFFPLFSIVPAPAAFLSPLQDLALQLARISIVNRLYFFRKNFASAREGHPCDETPKREAPGPPHGQALIAIALPARGSERERSARGLETQIAHDLPALVLETHESLVHSPTARDDGSAF